LGEPILQYRSPPDPTEAVHNPEATASAAFAGMIPVLLAFVLMTGAGMDSRALFGVWLLLSAAAIALGRAGRERSRKLGGKGRMRSQLGIAGGVGGLVLIVLGYIVFVGAFSRGIERANRIKCAYNLKRIHGAVQAFARDHDGALPSSTGDFLDYIDAHAFVCPATDDRTALGPTTREVAVNLAKAEYCSYVYVGAGTTWPVSASVVLAYEESDNHGGDGMHVLFGDGVVKWYSEEEAEQLLKKLNAPKSLPAQ
jgi:hypothetical protein